MGRAGGGCRIPAGLVPLSGSIRRSARLIVDGAVRGGPWEATSSATAWVQS
jgi:hypothetical protein